MSSQTISIIIAIIVILAIIGFIIYKRKGKAINPIGGSTSDIENKQLYIGNLSYQVNEQELKDLFQQYGSVEQVRIVKNYSSGRSKGFGFVTYNQIEDAKRALAAHGTKYQGRTIVVRIAKPR